jgi:hypothetical protein
MASDVALRVAAVLFALDGIGFGIPCVVGIRSLATGHGVPLILGFPSYGGGPFERFGIQSTVPLLCAFLVVCILELVAAWLVWDGRTAGAILGIGLLPVGAVFWYGFALPFPPIFAVARTALTLWHWDRLS